MILLHRVKYANAKEEVVEVWVNWQRIFRIFPYTPKPGENTVKASYVEMEEDHSWDPFFVIETPEQICDLIRKEKKNER